MPRAMISASSELPPPLVPSVDPAVDPSVDPAVDPAVVSLPAAVVAEPAAVVAVPEAVDEVVFLSLLQAAAINVSAPSAAMPFVRRRRLEEPMRRREPEP